MSGIASQLFVGQDIRFGPIDHDKDPEIESKWTHDAQFMRSYQFEPARPVSAAILRKQYEKLEKQIDEEKKLYYFTIRAKADDRLIGKATIEWIEWTNGNGFLRFGIGSADDRRKGYGAQALKMLLRFGCLDEHPASALRILMFGGEVLYGRREDSDGNSGDDVRLQFSAQYRF